MTGPQTVSPALAVGTAPMGDPAVLREVRAAVAVQAARREAPLRAAGLNIAGRTPLVALVRHRHAGALFKGLGRAPILTRSCAARPGALRFGNPAGIAEAALRSARETP